MHEPRRTTRATALPSPLTRRRASVVFLLLLLLFVAARARAADQIVPGDVSSPVAWGAAARVTSLKHLYFADQPDAAGFKVAKQAGVTTVIDLRAPAERDWDEKAVVEGLGLAYYNVPLSGKAFDRAAIERVEALVAAQAGKPVLIYCSSSNRAGGWLATHLVTKHGLDEEDALAAGRRAGITKDFIVQSVRSYLRDEAS